MTALRTLGLTLVFGAGFALVCLVQRPLVPWPEDVSLAAKMTRFAETADDYDVVFVGSSRVFRAFDPLVFDAELARRGIDVRSFNLGVGGVKPFEMDLMLRDVVERRPRKLRWILYEGGAFDPRIDTRVEPVENRRMVYWHAPSVMPAVLGSIRHAVFEPRDHGTSGPVLGAVEHACEIFGLRPELQRVLACVWRADLARMHVQILLWNLTNYGQGRAMVGARLGEVVESKRKANLTAARIDAGRGYVPLEEDGDALDIRRAQILRSNPAEFVDLVATLRARNAQPVDVEALLPDVVREQQARARVANAELVFVVLPDKWPTPDRRALVEAGAIDTLLDFNLPDTYPQLFTLDARYDAGHLSRAGAAEFSRLLAERFAEHVASRR